MTERLKSTSNVVSNDEVVEDLTKDLESHLVTKNDVSASAVKPGSSAEDVPTAGDNTENFFDIPLTDKDFDDDYKEKDNANSDTDSIDEVALKDAELELTDDQKEERRIIAEELKNTGNNAFKSGEYQRSIEKYTEGLKICPLQYTQQRAILYCNRSAAKMKLQLYEKAIKDCNQAIELDDKYVKAYIRRAQSYESSNKFDESLADYKKILEFDPSNKDARAAEIRLPPLIEKKNEELKNEMLGKLKDLGNMILKPFGLSTANFQMEQDPESKGYKINFKQ